MTNNLVRISPAAILRARSFDKWNTNSEPKMRMSFNCALRSPFLINPANVIANGKNLKMYF